jgi:hypothetical protein
MRDLAIAYGNSCFAKNWSNKTIRFAELCSRLEHTIRTSETVEEYPKLPKAERDRAKDKGGFVGGHLKGNSRKRENVAFRSMLTHDADRADKDFISRYEAGHKYASCLYTTHGHTSEAPRIRIIVPLARDVTPDEYIAIARYFSEELGMDMFDECSYYPNQLMYWPTTPSNGEYIFKRCDGEWLDPDKYLAKHPNWRDCSLLPTSSRESKVTEISGKHQENPLEKPGIIGTFCRTYSITETIEKFLPDVYAPSVMDGRYDYIPADSTAGVVIYDDVSAIIAVNRRRWQIEECFRIMKSEFKARPVYLSRDDRIKAHFTTCFLALLIYRILEKKLEDKYTCSEIIDGLVDMNFFELKGEGYSPSYTRTDFTDSLHDAFGFRTDYEITTSSQMKKIFKLTQKR